MRSVHLKSKYRLFQLLNPATARFSRQQLPSAFTKTTSLTRQCDLFEPAVSLLPPVLVVIFNTATPTTGRAFDSDNSNAYHRTVAWLRGWRAFIASCESQQLGVDQFLRAADAYAFARIAWMCADSSSLAPKWPLHTLLDNWFKFACVIYFVVYWFFMWIIFYPILILFVFVIYFICFQSCVYTEVVISICQWHVLV